MVDVQSGIVIAINVILAVVGIGIGAFIVWYILRELRFKDEVIILQVDGAGNLNKRQTKGGVFVDKTTNNKRFFLKKEKVGLNPDNIPYIPCRGGFFSSGKAVLLLQIGLKNFRYLKPKFKENVFTYEVGEEDVNWGINAYERQKKLFQTSFWSFIMPYIPLIIVSFIILILFVYLFKQLATVKDIVLAMHEVTKELAKAKMGTVIC